MAGYLLIITLNYSTFGSHLGLYSVRDYQNETNNTLRCFDFNVKHNRPFGHGLDLYLRPFAVGSVGA